LVLFGHAIDFLPHFVVTLAELGRQGLGPARVPFEVQTIVAQHPAGDEPLYDPFSHEMRRPTRTLLREDLVHPASCPSDGERRTLEIRFRTPTLLRTGSGVDATGRRVPAREIHGAPPFGILVRRLRDRLSALSAFFEARPWQRTDFAELGDRADEVELVASETHWEQRSRRSTRTGRRHELSGFVGTATYGFPSPAHLDESWPLLRFGELMHVGKHAVWGNGWLELSMASGATAAGASGFGLQGASPAGPRG
jgi:hypothetical protein